jgi:hypothetical protein
MKIRHIIPKGDLSRQHKLMVIAEINDLPDDRPWLIQATKYVRRRTLDQNSFLHGVPLKMICDHTGYDIEDIKAYLMGQAFGWEEYEIFGNPRKRPRLSTSQLNTEQFNWFLEWLEAWASQELGMTIPKPNEVIE